MIIACDLDRTLIPNGFEDNNSSLERFYEFVKDFDHTLVYATGRNLEMVRSAYEEFGLKVPDYLLASVGTMVYKREGDKLSLDPNWIDYVYTKHPEWDREEISLKLDAIEELEYQEEEVQNEFKISFYVKTEEDKEEIEKAVHQMLEGREGIEIVYSVDPHKKIGLLDILPTTATKLGALEYIRVTLEKEKEDVIYAGDSGNDILPLTYGYKGILVKNAPDEVKEEVLNIAKAAQISELVYVASGQYDEDGNYASGVIEGIKHFKEAKD